MNTCKSLEWFSEINKMQQENNRFTRFIFRNEYCIMIILVNLVVPKRVIFSFFPNDASCSTKKQLLCNIFINYLQNIT